MDGQFDKLEELIYVESHLSNTSAKFYGEITQQMLKNSSFPGSNNGTGLLQTIIGLKVGAGRWLAQLLVERKA
jgi:phosphoribulokinase